MATRREYAKNKFTRSPEIRERRRRDRVTDNQLLCANKQKRFWRFVRNAPKEEKRPFIRNETGTPLSLKPNRKVLFREKRHKDSRAV
jgi:hypothetical protein